MLDDLSTFRAADALIDEPLNNLPPLFIRDGLKLGELILNTLTIRAHSGVSATRFVMLPSGSLCARQSSSIVS